MNYIKLIERVLQAAIVEPGVSTAIEGDIFQINAVDRKDYPIFCVSSTQPHIEMENMIEYHLTLYYIDREMAASNQVNNPDISSVHSRGIDILTNIIARLRMDAEIYDIPYGNAITCWSDTAIFNDKCAGVYTDLTVRLPKETVCVR